MLLELRRRFFHNEIDSPRSDCDCYKSPSYVAMAARSFRRLVLDPSIRNTNRINKRLYVLENTGAVKCTYLVPQLLPLSLRPFIRGVSSDSPGRAAPRSPCASLDIYQLKMHLARSNPGSAMQLTNCQSHLVLVTFDSTDPAVTACACALATCTRFAARG